MWKRDRNPVATTSAPAPAGTFEDVATAPIEILSIEVGKSLAIPVEDAEELLVLACAILKERPSRVAVLEDGRLTQSSACLLASAAAELQA